MCSYGDVNISPKGAEVRPTIFERRCSIALEKFNVQRSIRPTQAHSLLSTNHSIKPRLVILGVKNRGILPTQNSN